MRNDTTLLQRFWSKVDREPDDGCWVWSGTRGGSGRYGMVRNEFGEVEFAHRVAWRLANGSIPDGLFVCHHCDYPPCVRPTHLFLGTALENTHDSIRKGRAHVKRRTMRRVISETAIPYESRSIILSIRITPTEYKALTRYADHHKCAISDVVRLGMEQYVNDKAA